MKTHLYPTIKITLMLVVLVSVIYPTIVWAMAQLSPNQGKGALITDHNRKFYKNIGQSFTDPAYFWSRPSAVGYNAAGSGGSNKAPSNSAYLAEVKMRIETFLSYNPKVSSAQVPVDLVTASGSGLDPDLSVSGAKIQIERIAKIRNVSPNSMHSLVEAHTQKPLWGIFGPEKVNVLELNIALDQLTKK
jgi:potassium-transporting ATPase KdpC subunit